MAGRIVLVAGLAVIAGLLVSACDSGRGEDGFTSQRPSPGATLVRAHLPREANGPLAVCVQDDGSVITATGNTLCLKSSDYAVGDTVSVTAENWEDTVAIEFYLLTEEQRILRFSDLKNADVVRLGEALGEGGSASFEFLLESSFETVKGNTLHIASGQRLHLWALQEFERSASAHSTSFRVK